MREYITALSNFLKKSALELALVGRWSKQKHALASANTFSGSSIKSIVILVAKPSGGGWRSPVINCKMSSRFACRVSSWLWPAVNYCIPVVCGRMVSHHIHYHYISLLARMPLCTTWHALHVLQYKYRNLENKFNPHFEWSCCFSLECMPTYLCQSGYMLLH